MASFKHIWRAIPLVVFSLVAVSNDGLTQVESDLESWTGGQINTLFGKRWKLGTEYQFRTKNNLQSKKQSFTEFSLRFKAAKWLYLKPAFRLVRMPNFNLDRKRFSFDLMLKLNKKDWPIEFSNRLRVQYYNVLNQDIRGGALRNRLGASYKINKTYDAFVTYEMFFMEEGFTDYRWRFGTDVDLPKKFSLTVYYGLERQRERAFNDITHILGLSAQYRLKVKTKKKQKADE